MVVQLLCYFKTLPSSKSSAVMDEALPSPDILTLHMQPALWDASLLCHIGLGSACSFPYACKLN